ncbi:hypothetical protein [Streptomyces wuyuanensis]|uniref:hypothetical protein n=1 Tax=Streptomyces wuyuanensis TaxID=1196353 RepID=UPI0037139941
MFPPATDNGLRGGFPGDRRAGCARRHDAVAPGLDRRLRDVILANAEAHGLDPESAARE